MIINKAWNLFQLISGSIKKGNACINKIYIESLNYVSNKMFIEPKSCAHISVSKRIHFSSNTAFFSSSSSSFSPFPFLPLFLLLLDRITGIQFWFQTRQHSGFTRDGTTLTEKTKASSPVVEDVTTDMEGNVDCKTARHSRRFSRQANDWVLIIIKNLALGGERTNQRTCTTHWSSDGSPLPSTTCQGARHTRQLLCSPACAVTISDKEPLQ